LATEFYVIASAALNASVTTKYLGDPQYGQAGGNPLVKECPAMWAQIQKVEANWARPRPINAPPILPEPIRYGTTISLNKELLWSCASDRIAEAERLMGPTAK